jgi:dynein heavy chain 1
MLSNVGNLVLSKLRKMKTLIDDDDETSTVGGTLHQGASQQPAWMRALHQHCQEWLSLLPKVGKLMM